MIYYNLLCQGEFQMDNKIDLNRINKLFILGFQINKEVSSSSPDYINLMTLMRKYINVFEDINGISKIRFLFLLKWKMKELHFLILNSYDDKNFTDNTLSEKYVNILCEHHLKYSSENIINKFNINVKNSRLMHSNGKFNNDIMGNNFNWELPSISFTPSYNEDDGSLLDQIQKNIDTRYSVVVNNNDIHSISKFDEIKNYTITFPEGVDDILIIDRDIDNKFENTYMRLFETDVYDSENKPIKTIAALSIDYNNFIYRIILLPLGKPFRKAYLSLNRASADTVKILEKNNRIASFYLSPNILLDKFGIDNYSTSFVISVFCRLNKYIESDLVDKPFLNELNFMVEVLNGFEEKYKSKNITESNSNIFGFRKRPEGPNDNKYKLIKLKKDIISSTGEGTPHRFHASPRRHIRKGHWRRKKNGEKVWIKATVINKSNDPTLYVV